MKIFPLTHKACKLKLSKFYQDLTGNSFELSNMPAPVWSDYLNFICLMWMQMEVHYYCSPSLEKSEKCLISCWYAGEHDKTQILLNVHISVHHFNTLGSVVKWKKKIIINFSFSEKLTKWNKLSLWPTYGHLWYWLREENPTIIYAARRLPGAL